MGNIPAFLGEFLLCIFISDVESMLPQFSQKSYLSFQQANLSAIRKKVLELNEELLTDVVCYSVFRADSEGQTAFS